MICLLQRVLEGSVTIDNQSVAQIEQGLVVLCGFQPNDSHDKLKKMAKKLLSYRVFADDNGRMNLNVQQVDGGVILVPQFTLAADTQSGLRPSFSTSAAPDIATQLFDQFITECQALYAPIQQGQFGADMKVGLINDGPVTFWLEN